jgi:hypothetical protein
MVSSSVLTHARHAREYRREFVNSVKASRFKYEALQSRLELNADRKCTADATSRVTGWRIVVNADRKHAAKVNKEDPGWRRDFFTGTTRLGTIVRGRLSSREVGVSSMIDARLSYECAMSY